MYLCIFIPQKLIKYLWDSNIHILNLTGPQNPSFLTPIGGFERVFTTQTAQAWLLGAPYLQLELPHRQTSAALEWSPLPADGPSPTVRH